MTGGAPMSIDLEKVKTICVVGLRNNKTRPAYYVADYLKNRGIRIIPVNPLGEDALGEKGYKRISDIPSDIKVDLADFFINSERVLPLVEEALQRGIKNIWLQQGVVCPEATEKVKEYDAKIEMNKCIKMAYMY